MVREPRPSFFAACLAALGGYVAASFVLGLVLLPFALVASTAVAFAGDPSASVGRVLLPWVLLLALQPFLAAWVAKRGLDIFDAGRVTYARALGAMILGLLVTTVCAFLPVEAALPVVGYAWTGALAAAVVLAA